MTDTKTIMAKAFKELLLEVPFQKISVNDICEKCGMNRKSFYYHFCDKYDIANSVFDIEFPALSEDISADGSCSVFRDMSVYLYDNRAYYKKLFEIEGQNCFTDYLSHKIEEYLKINAFSNDSFRANFWADAVCCSYKEWILDKKTNHYSDFYRRFRSCLCLAFPVA